MKNLSRNSKILISILIVPGSIFFAAVLFMAILHFANSGRIIYGLALGGEKIGGLSQEKTRNLVENKFRYLGQKEINIVFGEKDWQLSAENLGFSFNLERTLAQISSLGHKNNILSSLYEQVKTFFFKLNMNPQIDFNAQQFEKTLTYFASIEKTAQSARLIYNQKNSSFTFSAEKTGEIINREVLKNNILENLNGLTEGEIKLTLKEDRPLVKIKDLKSIEPEAQALVEQSPFILINGSLQWPIDKKVLASWISIDQPTGGLTLDKNEIIKYLPQIAMRTDLTPTNVRLTMKKNTLEILAPAQNGKKLNTEASGQKIKESIIAGQKNIELVLDLITPEITEQKIKDLGIRAFLGRGESNFAGSPKNRKYNLTLGSSKLNGWLIKPREEFSFNQTLGEVDEKNGYLPELVIKNKQTVPDYGGGICQVSTTLFRAAVNSGLKITERQPHAYPVRYYYPTGFDATVYSPSPDLKFINDTPNYILLQNKIEDTKLIFEIYGTTDGRDVKIKGPFVTESNTDGSIKTVLTQEIWRDGVLESQNIFRSSYKPASLYPVSTSTPATSPSPSPSPMS